jgi:hypothetical protein
LELLGLTETAPPIIVTRRWITAAIEDLRPQVRQIIRLSLEERRTRRATQDYLHGISERTLEREQNAGLDELIDQAAAH